MKVLRRSMSVVVLLAAPALGCSGEAAKPEPSGRASTAGSTPAPPASSAPAVASEPLLECGGLPCKDYDTVAHAFAAVLEDKPLVLAIGETHAQKAVDGVPSVTKRFTEELLPSLKDKAAGMIVELPYPDPKCSKKQVEKAQTDQKEIIKDQKESNQSEFQILGKQARSLGIAADGLMMGCDDLSRLEKAYRVGQAEGALEWMLTIASKTTTIASTFFAENKKKSPEKMILTYGGAIHNDLVPVPGREDWSYAKALEKLSDKRYVELDLIVPELVTDAPNFQKMPWFEAIKKGALCTGEGAKRKRTIVYTTSPHAYALVFPCTPA